MTEGRSLNPKDFAGVTFNKALVAQRPAALAYVARLRRVHPQKSPAQLTKVINRWYLTVVTSTGAASGAAAIVPNGWLQIPVALADLGTFLQASVFYTLAVAEIHGMHPEDIERRRLLVTLVLMGDSTLTTTLKPILGKSVPYWGKAIVNKIPMSAINAANKVLGPRFITKYGTKQGVLVLGKQIPFGIGVLVGAGGNHGFGWLIIRSAKKILGPAPVTWDQLETKGAEVQLLNTEVGETDDAVEFIINDELPETNDSDAATAG
jgi:hypothetical protein